MAVPPPTLSFSTQTLGKAKGKAGFEGRNGEWGIGDGKWGMGNGECATPISLSRRDRSPLYSPYLPIHPSTPTQLGGD